MADSQVEYGTRIVARNSEHNLGGAVMRIEAGKKTDMCFHVDVTKVLYVMNGQVKMSIIKGGQIKALDLKPGSSFYIDRGLVYQLEAAVESIVVEFPSDPNKLYGDIPDINVVSRGSAVAPASLPTVAPGSAVRMTEEDKVALKKETPKPRKRAAKKKSKRSARSKG